MQRINLSVDMNNNEVLDAEITRAIEQAVKSKVREFFAASLEAEVKRLVDARTKEYLDKSSYFTPLATLVRDRINTVITEHLATTILGPEALKFAYRQTAADVEQKIVKEISDKVDKMKVAVEIEAMVQRMINKRVASILMEEKA